ncbi:phosphomevalonate kinase [Enterococcus timonensis]|uniref:phosphomevalonate kinase n=1 Tax=Enterococcus timonensis TaxID=1852364 RepID=UPI0008DA5D16|nr:phosphomevalonate kinase [Enterococcus timonensis]
MITVSAPGKLFIAGEYAVVEPGNPAIIIAVDQFVTVTLSSAQVHGSIKSAQFSNYPVYFKRKNNALVVDKRDNPFHYILAAIDIVENYAREEGKTLELFHLQIASGLDNGKGTKYGLGSSGAVTVATVEALCLFYQLPYNEMILFKLAALAHLSIQNNGSCGDVAASVYGGWLAFSTFDQEWVLQQIEKISLKELLNTPWPKLAITPITPPENLQLLIGWTGTPASTANLVDQVQQSEQKDAYQIFLQKSNACVNALIAAFADKDLTKIQEKIIENRQLLQNLSQLSAVNIETSALNQLVEVADEFGGAAKSSGAGGGDCGIAIFKDANTLPFVQSAWEKVGISPLPLHVFYKTQEDVHES